MADECIAFYNLGEVMLTPKIRGEQTATAMENKLSQLESRIEELLANVGESNGAASSNVDSKTRPNGNDATKKA